MRTVGILFFAFLYHSTFAQNIEAKSNQISVFGTVELKATADLASFYLSVKGVGATLRQAVESADKKTKNITDKLAALGIRHQNISTSQFYSGENSGDRAFLSSSRDFKATITTLVKIDSLDLLQPALFLVSEEQAESLSDISFSLKNEFELRRRARVEAAIKAKEKAEDLAKSLGVILGKPISVEEIPTQSPFSNSSFLFRGGRVSPTPFNSSTTQEAGTVDDSKGSGFFAQLMSVTSQVRVVFEIK